MKKNIFVFIALGLFWAGCSKSDTLTGPVNQTPTQPKAGSTFMLKTTPIDTNGVYHPENAKTEKDSVMESGIIFAGKTNVTHIMAKVMPSNSVSEAYFNYESNGDFSIYASGSTSADAWVTYPFGSQTPVYRTQDTTTIDGAFSVRIVENDTISVDSRPNLTINGTTLSTVKLKLVSLFTLSILGTSSSSRSVSYISYAPAVGYIVSAYKPPVRSASGSFNGSETVLTSYSLK